jgi:hypothetical protein
MLLQCVVAWNGSSALSASPPSNVTARSRQLKRKSTILRTFCRRSIMHTLGVQCSRIVSATATALRWVTLRSGTRGAVAAVTGSHCRRRLTVVQRRWVHELLQEPHPRLLPVSHELDEALGVEVLHDGVAA